MTTLLLLLLILPLVGPSPPPSWARARTDALGQPRRDLAYAGRPWRSPSVT